MREGGFLELYELQQIIRAGVEEAVPGPVRVRAEIASLQQRANGHCYLELAQSGPQGPVAKVRAVIWRTQAAAVLSKFAKATGAPLGPGVAVIFEVRVNYSELYGMTLVISDVDVEHTLGEAELRRRENIDRLKKEGLLDLQKELALPDIPYRLAVISAEDAAGYGDFRRHLLENEYGFVFDVTLFPATMQGDSAPASIAFALSTIASSSSLWPNGDKEAEGRPRGDGEAVRGDSSPRPLGVQGDSSLPRRTEGREAEGFDAILILRGGGSTLDLACFDDYDLCAAIARCPIPVFTAIGHDRDTHIADMVACEAVKTPTALADLFIDAVAQEDERIQDLAHRLRIGLLATVSAAESALDRRLRILSLAMSGKISREEQKLSDLQSRIFTFNPRKLLESGYTLVTDASGRLLKQAGGIRPGDTLDVHFPDGTVNCTVNG